MDESVRELLASLFHFPAGIMVESVHPSTNDLVIRVSCRNPSMPCPDCHQPSYRIHSHYQRIVADVPCAGRNVILALTVRKFVCHTPGCPHRIFTERLPELVLSYARLTRRLTWLLQIIGLAAGGELGTRLAERSGIATAPSTLLRYLMKYPTGAVPPVRVLGVDDWSWKKGRRYGTLLVDLERHKIIDVLEDRESATFAAWLLGHPEVEIVSRDRATQYASAARKAAPQARQIADRFHVVHNLVDVLERLLARCRPEICGASQAPLPKNEPIPEEPLASLPSPQVWRQHPSERAEQAHEAHRIEREDRYRQIAALRAQGVKQAEIAKLLGVSTYQVRTWLKQGGAPVHRHPAGHRSIFDPYAAYVLDRWKAGTHDGKQLYEEIQQRGFRGSKRLVQNFLQTLRGSDRQPLVPLPPVVPSQSEERFSAHNAVWLFIRDQAKFTDAEKETLTLIRQRSATAETAYGLVQDFLTMVRKREGKRLDAWIKAVLESEIPELNSFVCGILKDKDAFCVNFKIN